MTDEYLDMTDFFQNDYGDLEDLVDLTKLVSGITSLLLAF